MKGGRFAAKASISSERMSVADDAYQLNTTRGISAEKNTEELRDSDTYRLAVEFQAASLPLVSRTFALTIPQLPDPLNLVVGNAYLWCRLADTIEDEPRMDALVKQTLHADLIAVLEGEKCVEEWSRRALAQLTEATVVAERDLVANTDKLATVTATFSECQRAAIKNCLRKMCFGMSRFEKMASTDGLTDIAELNNYCYYVAGVVGEMLTELFCDHAPEIADRKEELSSLSTSFGQGLQMTNILKDVFEDYQDGRCWLPRDLFSNLDLDLTRLDSRADRADFQVALQELIAIAHGHLRNALDYALVIPRDQEGIRSFCLWSLGLAVLTLRKLATNPDFAAAEDVKVSRLAVATTITVSNFCIHHDLPFRLMFEIAGRRVPYRPVAFGYSGDLHEPSAIYE